MPIDINPYLRIFDQLPYILLFSSTIELFTHVTCKFIETKGSFYIKKGLTSIDLFLDTNMATVSLFGKAIWQTWRQVKITRFMSCCNNGSQFLNQSLMWFFFHSSYFVQCISRRVWWVFRMSLVQTWCFHNRRVLGTGKWKLFTAAEVISSLLYHNYPDHTWNLPL